MSNDAGAAPDHAEAIVGHLRRFWTSNENVGLTPDEFRELMLRTFTRSLVEMMHYTIERTVAALRDADGDSWKKGGEA